MLGQYNSEQPNTQVELADVALRGCQSCNLELLEQGINDSFKEYTKQRRIPTQIQRDTLKKVREHIKESEQLEKKSSGRCWLLLTILFTFCIPEQLKKHIQQRIQILAGILFFCGLIIGYIVLYIVYGRSKEQVFLTSEKPDKFIECNQTLISHTKTYTLTHDFQWRGGELESKFLMLGDIAETRKDILEPWQVSFFQYEANAEKFEMDMNAFITNISSIASQNDARGQKFFQEGIEYNSIFNNFIRLLFYNQQEKGSEGFAVVNFNFQQKYFGSFSFQSTEVCDFNFNSIEDFKDFQDIYEQYFFVGNCFKNDQMRYLFDSYNWNTFTDTINFANFSSVSFVNQVNNHLQNDSYPYQNNISNIELQDMFKNIVEKFKTISLISIDFTRLFVYHYCYTTGVQTCLSRYNSNYDFILFEDILPNNLLYLQRTSLINKSASILDKKWFAMRLGTFIQPDLDFEYLNLDFYAVPFIYSGQSIEQVTSPTFLGTEFASTMSKWKVILHIFAFAQSSHTDTLEFNFYVGSTIYNFDNLNDDYLPQIVKNSLFQNKSYTNKTQPPFTLTSGVYSCRVQNTPSMLERIANTHATGELVSIVLIILIIIVFILIVLPKLSTRQGSIVDQLSDAIVALFTQLSDS